MFGLLILAVVAATALCMWMRFGRWACLLVALTWLLTALVMLGGVGECAFTLATVSLACWFSVPLLL